MKTPWLGRADGDERPFAVERRALKGRPKPVKHHQPPKPKRAPAKYQQPIPGGPRLRSGSWDFHQFDEPEDE